jgi:oligoendopeptidase F
MLDAVEGHYAIAHRWFRVKAGILGLDRLELHDQYAPIGQGRSVDYPEARDLIGASFGRF